MPIKRAIWIGVVAYAVTFIVGLVVGLVFSFDTQSDLGNVPTEVLYTGALIAVLIVSAACWWFFRADSATPSYKHGLYFGLISIGIGFVLDFVSVLPFGNPVVILGGYYTQPFFIITLLLILGGTTGMGYWLESKQSGEASVQQEE